MPRYVIPGKPSSPPPKPPPKVAPKPPPPKPQVKPPPKPVSTKGEDNRFANMKATPPPPPPKKTPPPPPPPPPSQYRYVPSYATPENAKKTSDANLAKAVRDLNSPNKQDRDQALKVLAPTKKTPPPPPPPPPKKPPSKPKVVTPPPVVEDIPEVIFDPPVYATPPSGGSSNDDTTPPPAPIKSAPIDTVLFNDEQVSAEIIADLLFENIGGQEILSIARHDTVNGQDVTYQPIKNLSAIQQQYSSETLVKIKSTAKDIFGNFPIDIQSKIPNVGNGPGGSNYYLDADGNIILEFVNLENGQEIEVQITSSGTIESIGE
jgi:hypothetical protein